MANKQKKKLLMIGPLPPPYAGPEIGTMHLLKSTSLKRAYDIHHINTSLRASNAERGRLDFTMIMAYLKYLFLLIKALIVFRPDHVLYCIISATKKGWVRDGSTILLCRLAGLRVVMQFRGGHFRYFYGSLSGYQKSIIKWLLGQSGMVLVQADILKTNFAGLLPESKIGKLYNSIPTEFYSAFEGYKREKTDSDVNILFVGHQSFAKGYCDLLKTVSKIMKTHKVRLTCIGSPLEIERNVFYNQATGEAIQHHSPAEYFEKYIVDHGFEDRIIFLGDRVSGEKKIVAFKDADIFVLPSYSEGFSMAILEGMSSGLPVIATCVGAVPEIITDGVNGYIITPGDTVSLYDRLKVLVENKNDRDHIGNAAREYCRKNFVGESGPSALVAILEGTRNE